MPLTTYLSRSLRSTKNLLAATLVLAIPVVIGAAPAGAQRPLVTGHGVLQVNGYNLGATHSAAPILPCGFNVSFFGYDVGVQHAAIIVTPMVPTLGGSPVSLRVTWSTITRTSAHQLDQNVVFSPALLLSAFANATSSEVNNHAMISVQITGRAHSSLNYHPVWISTCLPATPASTPSATAGSSSNNVSNAPPVGAVQLGLLVGATQRVGGTGAAYQSSPTRLVVGEQMQFHVDVVNTGNATLLVHLNDALCDPLTLSPTPPQSLAPGGVLTYFCSHVFFNAPASHRVQNVAIVSATSALGGTVAPLRSKTTVLVFWPAYVSAG